MQIAILCWVLLGWVIVVPMAAQAEPLNGESSVSTILEALESAGKNLRDFSADVAMIELDNTTGAAKTRTGAVWYVRQADGTVKMKLTLDKLTDDRGTFDRKIEYLLKDGWLIDRDYSAKIEVSRQVLRPGETIDLLKLGEGPFPLPIGQSPATVEREFEVSSKPAEEDVLEEERASVESTVRVQLVPREDSQFQRQFSSIDLWIDPISHFPRRIMTTTETDVRITDLSNPHINQGIDAARFDLPAIAGEQWNQRSEPLEQP